MDLATMIVVLLFKGGEAQHFVRAERDMGACMGALGGKTRLLTPPTAETDYVIYRICLPGSARLFSVPRVTIEIGQQKDRCGGGAFEASATAEPGALYLQWRGEISSKFYRSIAFEIERWKSRVRKVLLELSSCGGDGGNMERSIRLLKHIKRTHRLETIVDRGEKCGSACVFIFLQGQRRWGALTSSWLFHEASYWHDRRMRQIRVDRAQTGRVLEQYFPEAGVSEGWLNRLRVVIQHSDYWQTGENLWKDKSGIITDPLDNHAPRGTEQQQF